MPISAWTTDKHHVCPTVNSKALSSSVKCSSGDSKTVYFRGRNIFDFYLIFQRDLDDINSEEVSKSLEDKARHKLKHVYKRRKVYRKGKADTKGLNSLEGLGHKKPVTPTILTFLVGNQQGEKKRTQQQEVNNRKQKGCQKACAVRRRRKLERKIYAKQPKAFN